MQATRQQAMHRILLVEDDQADAYLTQRVFKDINRNLGGLKFQVQHYCSVLGPATDFLSTSA